MGCAAFLGLGLLGGIISSLSKNETQPAANVVAPKVATSTSPKVALSPAEHLNAAKHALYDGIENYHGSKGGFWGRLDEAQVHLNAIPKSAPEFEMASPLRDEVKRREANRAVAVKKGTAMLMRASREGFAKQLEAQYLASGMDIYVRATGKDKSTLLLKWALMSRPLVYKLINASDTMASLKRQGFTKLVCTDGYNETWTMPIE